MPAFLTQEEAALVLARIERDRGDSTAEPLTAGSMLRCCKDWKVWEFSSYVLLNVSVLRNNRLLLVLMMKHRTLRYMHFRTSCQSFSSKV